MLAATSSVDSEPSAPRRRATLASPPPRAGTSLCSKHRGRSAPLWATSRARAEPVASLGQRLVQQQDQPIRRVPSFDRSHPARASLGPQLRSRIAMSSVEPGSTAVQQLSGGNGVASRTDGRGRRPGTDPPRTGARSRPARLARGRLRLPDGPGQAGDQRARDDRRRRDAHAMPAHEPSRPVPPGRRPGAHRPPLEIAANVIAQVLDRGVAALRLLPERGEGDVVEVAAELPPESRRRGRTTVAHLRVRVAPAAGGLVGFPRDRARPFALVLAPAIWPNSFRWRRYRWPPPKRGQASHAAARRPEERRSSPSAVRPIPRPAGGC